jgi:eukaryotic-like serine/threonine-protein kinase
MAEIYRASMEGAHGFHKNVAIKKILSHLAEDPEFVRMFIAEAKITAGLQHSNIVQVYELNTTEGELFIAMEYVDGIDLLALLRHHARLKQRVDPDRAVYIASEVLNALHHAHEASGEDGAPLGIVHRDISPGNVLLSRVGQVKLTDFGIARLTLSSDKTQANTLKGKYSYMSPEQVRRDELDGRSDVFAVGVVLAEMLMCRRLFAAPSELDLLIMVREARIERLDKHGSDIDPDLRAILEKALRGDRDERFADAHAFAEALSDWLFEKRKRVSRDDIAAMVEEVSAQRKRKTTATGEKTPTLSGEATIREQDAAEHAAAAAREKVAARDEASDEQDDDIVIEIGPEVGEPAPSDPAAASRHEPQVKTDEKPDLVGRFDEVSPLRALYDLTLKKATGALVAERGNVCKELYLVGGSPQYVGSTSPRERLGEFLVSRGVISRAQLSRAVSVLPQFRGRLGDALIQLGTLNPFRALHWQIEQVREKLVDLCSWRDGDYRWYQNRTRDEEDAAPIAIDPFEILGVAARRLNVDHLGSWAQARADFKPRRHPSPPVEPEVFRAGERMREIWGLIDGKRTLAEVGALFSQRDSRVEAVQNMYLLVHTDLVRLAE